MVLITGQNNGIYGKFYGFNMMGATGYCYGCGTSSNNIWNMLYQSQNAVANGAYNMSTSLVSGAMGLFTSFCVAGTGKAISDAKANSYSGKTKTGEEIQEEINTKLQELGTGRTEENYADYKITDDKVYTDALKSANDEKTKATEAKANNNDDHERYLATEEYFATNKKRTEANGEEYDNMQEQRTATKAAHEAWLKADKEEKAANDKIEAIENYSDSTIKERKEAIEKTQKEITELIAERKQIMDDIVEKASKDGDYSKSDLFIDDNGTYKVSDNYNTKESDLRKAINKFKAAKNDTDRLAAQKEVEAIYKEYTGDKAAGGQNKSYSKGIQTAYDIVMSWNQGTNNDNDGKLTYKFGV